MMGVQMAERDQLIEHLRCAIKLAGGAGLPTARYLAELALDEVHRAWPDIVEGEG